MQHVVFVRPLQLEIVTGRNTGVVHHPSMHMRMDFVNSISKNGQYNESADFACECHGCRFCSSCENSQSEQLEDVSSVPNTQTYCAVNARWRFINWQQVYFSFTYIRFICILKKSTPRVVRRGGGGGVIRCSSAGEEPKEGMLLAPENSNMSRQEGEAKKSEVHSLSSKTPSPPHKTLVNSLLKVSLPNKVHWIKV